MSAEPIHVLAVEDDAVDRRFLQKALDAWDEPVLLDEAATAEEGLAKARDGDHDLILLDYRLPDGDGLAVLRALADRSRPPVVMLTGYGSEEVAVQAIKAGAVDYLAKDDLSGHRLRLTLENVLRTHELAQRVRAIGDEVDHLQDHLARRERVALIGVLSDRSLDGVRSGIEHVRGELAHLQDDVQSTAEANPEHREFLIDLAGTLEDDLARPLHEVTELVGTLETLFSLISGDPRPEAVDVDATVRDRLATFEAFAPDDVTIETDLRADGTAAVDPRTVGECLMRLLKNACEAGDGGTVTVRTRRSAGEVRLVVEDRGDGVPDAVRDRAFDLFVTTKPGHAGIGLTLVKHLTRNHGGTVGFEDRPEGGSRFKIRVPEIPMDG